MSKEVRMLIAADKLVKRTMKSDPLYAERVAAKSRIANAIMFG